MNSKHSSVSETILMTAYVDNRLLVQWIRHEMFSIDDKIDDGGNIGGYLGQQ